MVIRCYFIFWESDTNDPFAIRRNVSKPVIVIIIRQLFRIASVRFHAQKLNQAASYRIEINKFPIRTILRAVVEAGYISELDFLSSV